MNSDFRIQGEARGSGGDHVLCVGEHGQGVSSPNGGAEGYRHLERVLWIPTQKGDAQGVGIEGSPHHDDGEKRGDGGVRVGRVCRF